MTFLDKGQIKTIIIVRPIIDHLYNVESNVWIKGKVTINQIRPIINYFGNQTDSIGRQPTYSGVHRLYFKTANLQ